MEFLYAVGMNIEPDCCTVKGSLLVRIRQEKESLHESARLAKNHEQPHSLRAFFYPNLRHLFT